MLKFLKPKQSHIFLLFNELTALAVLAGEELLKFPDSFPNNVALGAQKMRELENKADDVTHAIIAEINKSFVTPLDREDLYLLAHRVDDVIDLAENAISYFVIYKIDAVRSPLAEFCKIIHQVTKEVQEVMLDLPNLKKAEKISEHTIKIRSLEEQGDELLKTALSDLFTNESDTKNILKWKDIFQSFERSLDRAQDVANVIEGIVLKNT